MKQIEISVVDHEEMTLEPGRGAPAELDYAELSRLGSLIESLSDACSSIAAEMAQLRAALKTAQLSSKSAIKRSATTGEYAYAMLRRSFADFLAHEPGTRLGEDPEELHQMRVAARRLRATIDLFQPALPPEFSGLEEELRWVAGVLGEVRDLQVHQASLSNLTLEAESEAVSPLIEALDARTLRAQAAVAGTLDGARYRALVRRMTEALLAGSSADGEAASPVQLYAAQALRHHYKTVRSKAGESRADSPDAELHKLRIKIKRLRYAVETFQPLIGRRLQPVRREAKALQDLLGEHQDHVVARAWMRDVALQEGSMLSPATLLQIGELIERRRFEMLRLRGAWPEAYARLRKRWRRAKRAL